jgi:hypothetical protein
MIWATQLFPCMARGIGEGNTTVCHIGINGIVVVRNLPVNGFWIITLSSGVTLRNEY